MRPNVFAGPHVDRLKLANADAGDVARAIVWVLTQPPHMEVHDVLVRPTGQRH